MLNNTTRPTTLEKTFHESKISSWLSDETNMHNDVCMKQAVNDEEMRMHGRYKMNSAYDDLRSMLNRKISSYEAGKYSCSSWTAILLLGLPGTGKNLALRELSMDLGIPLMTVSLLGWPKSPSPNYINDCFEQATKRAPSILAFDEIESLCLCGQDFCSKILKVLDQSKMLATPVILIGITSRPTAIPECLKQRGRFDREVILGIPDKEGRTMILQHLLESHQHDLEKNKIDSLGEKALGFTGADLDTGIRIGWQKAVQKWKTKMTAADEDALASAKEDESFCVLRFEDLHEGIEAVVPSFLRQNFSAVPKVRWSDIWGYDSTKVMLKKLVTENDLKGILLYGPPGCSKTMLVRALATETQFTFFPIKCSDLLSKYVGETERSLCRAFDTAMQSAPSLIFMDEIDSLCAERSSGAAATQGSIVSELLTILRKCSKKGNILVIGATNRPQAVDQALLSVGYLDVLLQVALPDCTARCSIWNGLLKQVPVSDICVSHLCSKTEGFSCAEICNAYQRAIQDLLESFHLDSAANQEVKLSGEKISAILSSMSPLTPQSLLSDIECFERKQLNTYR